MNKQRKVVITTTYNEMGIIIDTKAEEVAQPDLQPTCNQLATDCISRQAAIEAADKIIERDTSGSNAVVNAMIAWSEYIKHLPSAQPEERTIKRTETHACDCISRQAAIDLIKNDAFWVQYTWGGRGHKPEMEMVDDLVESIIKQMKESVVSRLEQMPSAQPERTCVNCGRTVNNGGWYADGGTRCPIEEHYALPKDGYCHLWEKRNVTDDDYPERRTDE